MNVDDFEKKYAHYGGIKQLVKMRNSFMPLVKIGEHFKVSRERVRQWMIEIFGSAYDPREERKKIAIKKMVGLYFKNSPDEFRRKFGNTAYYKEALKIIKKTII